MKIRSATIDISVPLGVRRSTLQARPTPSRQPPVHPESSPRTTLVSQSIAISSAPQSAPAQAYPDWIGVAASLLCAIHCAAMPFVVGFLPLLGLSFLADPSFHQWMVAVCLAMALVAFVPGWRRHHRAVPAIIGVLGLSLISFAAFAGPDDCCPTCDPSTAPTDPAGMAMVANNDDPTCADACCSSESPTAATFAVEVPNQTDPANAAPCAASCCATTNDALPMVAETPDERDATCCGDGESTAIATATAGPDLVAPTSEDACTAACCPADGGTSDTIMTAGSGEFMSLVWLLMTPLGGLILVIAHLTNHRLGCRCKSERCSSSPDTPANA
ncbi:MerC domain-containing protein [bacterium]|nr:MerC domain-containing protein [bacterium]